MAESCQDWQSMDSDHSSFSTIRNFLPNHGRILPGLTFNVLRPLNVNPGRILPWFGRKSRIVEKLDWISVLEEFLPGFRRKRWIIEKLGCSVFTCKFPLPVWYVDSEKKVNNQCSTVICIEKHIYLRLSQKAKSIQTYISFLLLTTLFET